VRDNKKRGGRVRTIAIPAIRVVVGFPAGDNRADTVNEGVKDLGASSGKPKAGGVSTRGIAVAVPVEQLLTADAEWSLRVGVGAGDVTVDRCRQGSENFAHR
jgi:hypothetical protein